MGQRSGSDRTVRGGPVLAGISSGIFVGTFLFSLERAEQQNKIDFHKLKNFNHPPPKNKILLIQIMFLSNWK